MSVPDGRAPEFAAASILAIRVRLFDGRLFYDQGHALLAQQPLRPIMRAYLATPHSGS